MTTPYLRNYYAGGGTSTTLANAMGEFDGSFVITADTGWPGGAGFFTVVVDRGTSSEEKIRCASNSGTTVTVASDGNGGRGYDGTSATGHNAGATVSLCGTSVDFDQANQVVTQVLGQSDAAKGDIPSILSAAGPVTMTRVPVGTNGNQWLGAAAGLPAYGIAPMTTTGDIIYASSSSAAARLAVGTNGQLLGLASGLPAYTSKLPLLAVDTAADGGSPPAAPGPFAMIAGLQVVSFTSGEGTLTFAGSGFATGCLALLLTGSATSANNISVSYNSTGGGIPITKTGSRVFCEIGGSAFSGTVSVSYLAIGW